MKDELKESTNITTNLTNNVSTSKEEANKSIYGTESFRNPIRSQIF